MEELLEILNELHPDIDFNTQQNLVDEKILDSFDIVTIISEVADVFDITISAEEIVPDNFNSASALYSLIEKKMDDED